MSESKILEYLNYLIFEYTENYYISKTIQNEIENNEQLRKLSQENNGMPEFGMLSVGNMFGKNYNPILPEEIPNFFDAKWAV